MMPQHNIPPHLNSQSLRRSRGSRPSVGIGGGTLGGVSLSHYQTPGGVSTKGLLQENPYQQPYLGRGAGLSDSPTSENGSDATLTDSELPPSHPNALSLQNGGLLMGGMDFATAAGKLNSLKRNLNTNGKSTTGLALGQSHMGNHDNLIDQFVVHSGGKIYIPQDTPKTTTTDYKSSPGSSPSKKISTSLLYKDTGHMGTLRDGRSMTKSDDADFMHKVKKVCCSGSKPLVIAILLLIASIVVNILFGLGALPMGSESAKYCAPGESPFQDNNHHTRQSVPGLGNGTYLSKLEKSSSSSAVVVLWRAIAALRALEGVRAGNVMQTWRRRKRSALEAEDSITESAPRGIMLHEPISEDGTKSDNLEIGAIREGNKRKTEYSGRVRKRRSDSSLSDRRGFIGDGNEIAVTASRGGRIAEEMEETIEYQMTGQVKEELSPSVTTSSSGSKREQLMETQPHVQDSLKIEGRETSFPPSWWADKSGNLNLAAEDVVENDLDEDAVVGANSVSASSLLWENSEATTSSGADATAADEDEEDLRRNIPGELIQVVNRPKVEDGLALSSVSSIMNIEETTGRLVREQADPFSPSYSETSDSFVSPPPPRSLNLVSQENPISTTPGKSGSVQDDAEDEFREFEISVDTTTKTLFPVKTARDGDDSREDAQADEPTYVEIPLSGSDELAYLENPSISVLRYVLATRDEGSEYWKKKSREEQEREETSSKGELDKKASLVDGVEDKRKKVAESGIHGVFESTSGTESFVLLGERNGRVNEGGQEERAGATSSPPPSDIKGFQGLHKETAGNEGVQTNSFSDHHYSPHRTLSEALSPQEGGLSKTTDSSSKAIQDLDQLGGNQDDDTTSRLQEFQDATEKEVVGGGKAGKGGWEMVHEGSSYFWIRWNPLLEPADYEDGHEAPMYHHWPNHTERDHFTYYGKGGGRDAFADERFNETSGVDGQDSLQPASTSPSISTAKTAGRDGGACECFCPCLEDKSGDVSYDDPPDDLRETSSPSPIQSTFPSLAEDMEEFIILAGGAGETSTGIRAGGALESSTSSWYPQVSSSDLANPYDQSSKGPPTSTGPFDLVYDESEPARTSPPLEENEVVYVDAFDQATSEANTARIAAASDGYSWSSTGAWTTEDYDGEAGGSSTLGPWTGSSVDPDGEVVDGGDFEWAQCTCSRGILSTRRDGVRDADVEVVDKIGAGIRAPGVSFPPGTSSFAQITLGNRLSNLIGAYSYWNMQFYQSDSAYVAWEISVPRGTSVGFYARRNALPTHTNYDFMEILRGFKARTTRSSPPSVTKEINKFIEQGHWFLSIYNDNSEAQEVIFASSISQEMTEGCPNGCSGNGQCQLGHCQCNGGFGGDDCSQSICPVLCSGRGEYVNGECQCNPGWKGKECNLRHDECEISDCNGHGKCVNGKCSCVRGYKGEFCQEVDCPHPTCTGHGFCLAGNCICKKGWRGGDCSQPDNEALQCLPDCSGHGVFSLETQNCTCEPRWTGEDCSLELCDTNCGAHGRCIGGGCQCSEGWTGQLCNQRVCDKRCGDHGQCKNGTCLCVTGWNGRHCTLEGCPNSCSGHGQCKANHDGFWECKCHAGWTGAECSVMMEQNCNDGQDNDKDGLTDCEDPECCLAATGGSSGCATSQLCVAAKKPIDILLRKQPPAITASFFEKMKFLIEEGSLQNYARQDAFNGSRSGVVRGRVVTPNGSGLMGVRVSSSSPMEPLGGFTLTQDDGWFDLMVNGGGAVTLHFGRSPFNPKTRTIFVPWNEVVIIDTVVMGLVESDGKSFVRGQTCDSHDYDVMKPVVLATWKHGFQGNCPESSRILVESQVVQESIRVPGTDLHLMYHSSRVQGYLSTIQLQLTPEAIPSTLKRVHLRITIEGVLFEKIFEADPNIKYTYAWNRLNVYRQRVYGVTTAIVKVGYEYTNCASTIWEVQSTTLSGHDMSISDVGGWNLDIHHRYNFHEGIIQKGDGTNIYLKHRPRVIITSMGNGYLRSLDCNADCNGGATKQRLLAPVALQASPDGSVFVGDFDLIRRMMIDGTVHTVVKLNATRVSYRYHMALSPVDNLLYISDPESHQIIRVRNIEETSDPERNWEPVVGSGERCLPGDEAHCGDDAPARDAKLAYPKGVAVSADNVVYFADGTNIRKVDKDGIITTVIGNHHHKSHWKPIPCEGTLKVEEVHLRWPTELVINPLDNSLYIIDDHMILKLTEDNRVRIIAGRPFHCNVPSGGFDADLATHTSLISPQSMTFASNGDLYVAESDSQRINRIRVITTDGKISHFAGADSKCNCVDVGCGCFEEDYFLAANSKFNTISAITMTADGVLHVSDQGNYRIRSIMASIPQAQAANSMQYEIYSPETQEVYVFNRFGQHVATKNIITGETKYTFLYNVNMSNGKLSSVTDSSGNKLGILRDYSQQVKSIENSQAQKFNLKMSRVRMLAEFSTPEGYNLTFDYHGATGLIKNRQDSSGRSSVYSYDEFGRLTMAISPTGQVITLTFDLSQKGASVTVARDGNVPQTVLIRGTSIIQRQGKMEETVSLHPDGSVARHFPWGSTITTESVPYNILADISPILSDSFPIPGKQRTEIAGDLVNRVEWRYVARKEGRGKNKQIVQIDKKMRINGENILVIEYDRESKSEIIFTDDRLQLLNVSYDRSSRPFRWSPRKGFAPVELEYDRFGRLVSWKWDDLIEKYDYDRSGRLYKIDYVDGTSLTLVFKSLTDILPMKMTTAGGSDYLIEHDESGAFKSLTTPRGHIHNFGISTSIGTYEYVYRAPSSRDVYRIQYNDMGQILAIIYPQGSGRVNYVYSKYGKLDAFLAGLRSAKFGYQETTGLLKTGEVSQSSFDVKVEFKYHGGMVKEERQKYGSGTGLDNVHLKYQYDGNGRISEVEAEINGKHVQGISLRKNQNTGVLESVHDLSLFESPLQGDAHRSFVVQDAAKQYQKITERDKVNRLRRVSLNVKGSDVFRLNLDYDGRGKIKHRKLTILKSSYGESISYDADGHVLDVAGSGNWKYVYDENGNIIQIMEEGEKSSLIYDTVDRVIQVGELLRYTYDSRGFLVQRGNEKFQYDDKGLLLHAVKKDVYKIWFFYDHLDRIVSWKDDQGNVTQFLYANPESPHLITHVHSPFWGKNYVLHYDSWDALVSIISSSDSQRYYVATDQNNSPVAVFNAQGSVVKEVHRSPFGKVVRDTNAEFYLPLGFHGGVVDQRTGLVIINGRPYDPSVGQWMVPLWSSLASTLKVPTDIFTYRHTSNDPITPKNPFVQKKMTSLHDWLSLFGYDVTRIFGQDYVSPEAHEPKISHSSVLAPEFGVVTGLGCMTTTATSNFKNLGFYRASKLKVERLLDESTELGLVGKVAYKKAAFGPGLLVSRMDSGKTLISTVENSVIQGVITSVLNGSLAVNFKSVHQNTFYFVKDSPHKLRDDTEELKRLGGLYNVSVHDVENGIKELRLATGDTNIAIRYGTNAEEEYGRLVKHAHRKAIEKAWEEEKLYISMGLDGRHAWTSEEREQLQSKGQVHGYRPTDLYSVHKYPQLADDPSNVIFQRDSRRKRRKSNKHHHHPTASDHPPSLTYTSSQYLDSTPASSES